MKKKMLMKRWGSLFLAFTLCIGMTACGDTKDTSGDAQKDSEKVSNASTEDAADASNDAAEEEIENFNSDGYPIVNESITVSMMGQRNPIQGDWDTLEFFEYMEGMTGISFTFDTPASDVFEEKKSLAIASESYPEVFFGANLTTSQQVDWGMNEGILIPLNDLIEKYAPNVQAMFDALPGLEASVTAPDGNIYALPQVNEAPIAYMSTGYYNGAWLQALGISQDDLPTTLDEFYDLLVRFRDEDPNGNGQADEIPLILTGSTTVGDIPESYILPAFGINSTKQYVEDGVVKYGAQQDNYKEYLKFLNKMYTEKLLDNSYITNDSVIANAAAKANTVGLIQTAIPQNSYDVTPEGAVDYYVLGALSSDYTNGEQRYAYKGSYLQQGTFAITDKCENPEAMMRWVNYLYSEEGSIRIHYGPEGDLWQYTSSGLREYNEKEGMSTEEYRGGILTPDCGTACPKWVRAETEGSWEDPFQPTRIAYTDEYVAPYAVQAFPSTYFEAEDVDRVSAINTDLDKYVEEMVAGFVVGNIDIDEKWDEFQETLVQMNVDELVEIYQTSYDIWENANQ